MRKIEVRERCSVGGCDRDGTLKTMCKAHYYMMRRNGNTDAKLRPKRGYSIDAKGYVMLCIDGRRVFEHVLVAEKAIGRALPSGAVVHHVNGNPLDNRNCNLVICPSIEYHALLHMRERALDACGNANYRKCPFCKQYSDPETMQKSSNSNSYHHAECKAGYYRARKSK